MREIGINTLPEHITMYGVEEANRPKKKFNPGGHKGKLHRELGIPVGEKIGAKRIAKAVKSSNPTIRRDAIRARTMSKWGK